MATISMITDHVLQPLSGYWYGNQDCHAVGQLSSDVTFDVPRGRVVHIASTNTETGTAQQTRKQAVFKTGAETGTKIPLLLLSNSADPSAQNPSDSTPSFVTTIPRSGGGNLIALSCTQGMEVETTEFDTGGTYALHTMLTADEDDTDVDVGGVIREVTTPANLYATTQELVIGVVSRGTYTNAHGKSVLSFWTFPILVKPT